MTVATRDAASERHAKAKLQVMLLKLDDADFQSFTSQSRLFTSRAVLAALTPKNSRSKTKRLLSEGRVLPRRQNAEPMHSSQANGCEPAGGWSTK